jgi:hypothetical protein
VGIARSAGVFAGTDETTGVSLAAGTTTTYSEVDVLGDNTSAGEVEVFCKVTFGTVAATAGLNIKVNKQRVIGGSYVEQSYSRSVTAVGSTTVRVPLGRMSASRYMSVTVQNTDASNGVTNLTVGYELFKVS